MERQNCARLTSNLVFVVSFQYPLLSVRDFSCARLDQARHARKQKLGSKCYNIKTQEHILPTTLTTKVLWILQNAFLTVQVYVPASLKVNARKLSTHPLDFKCLRSALLSRLLFFSHVTFSGRAPCAWHLSLICWPSTNSRKRSRFFDGFLNFGGLSSTKRRRLKKLNVKTFVLKPTILV